MHLSTLLPVVRYVGLGLFIVLNALICCVGVLNLTVAHESVNYSPTADAFLIFVSVAALLSALPIVTLEVLNKRAALGLVWVECTWLGIFWMLELAAAASFSATVPAILCATNPPSNGMSACNSAHTLVVCTWACMSLLLVQLALLAGSAVVHQRRSPDVWRSYVRDFPWFQRLEFPDPAPPYNHHRSSSVQPILDISHPRRPRLASLRLSGLSMLRNAVNQRRRTSGATPFADPPTASSGAPPTAAPRAAPARADHPAPASTAVDATDLESALHALVYGTPEQRYMAGLADPTLGSPSPVFPSFDLPSRAASASATLTVPPASHRPRGSDGSPRAPSPAAAPPRRSLPHPSPTRTPSRPPVSRERSVPPPVRRSPVPNSPMLPEDVRAPLRPRKKSAPPAPPPSRSAFLAADVSAVASPAGPSSPVGSIAVRPSGRPTGPRSRRGSLSSVTSGHLLSGGA